jgi:hypothetical protein
MADVRLIKGAMYRGRLQIDAPSWLVSDSAVKEPLQEQGFTDVTIWSDGDDLPANWPPEARSGVGGTTRWLEATWSKETGMYPSSGNRWKLIDYWVQQAPPGTGQPGVEITCLTEGYTCIYGVEFLACCAGLACKPDPDRIYGDPGAAYGDPPYRCMPDSGIEKLNEPVPSSNLIWWVGGIGLAGVLGWWAWPHLSKMVGGSKRAESANPMSWDERERLKRVRDTWLRKSKELEALSEEHDWVGDNYYERQASDAYAEAAEIDDLLENENPARVQKYEAVYYPSIGLTSGPGTSIGRFSSKTAAFRAASQKIQPYDFDGIVDVNDLTADKEHDWIARVSWGHAQDMGRGEGGLRVLIEKNEWY